jgi:hypothetical protein
VREEIKKKLHKQYENLDSLSLLNNLERLQNQFWQHALKAKSPFLAPQNLGEVNLSELNSSDLPLFFSQEVSPFRLYRRTPKPRKTSSP